MLDSITEKAFLRPHIQSPVALTLPIIVNGPNFQEEFDRARQFGRIGGFSDKVIAEAVVLRFLPEATGSFFRAISSYFKEQAFEDSSLAKFTPEQIKLLLDHTGAVQLSKGCSVGCAFCGFGASFVKNTEQSMAFSDVIKLFALAGDAFQKNSVFLYFGSDPFDYYYQNPWSKAEAFYPKVHELSKRLTHNWPFVSTSVPKGREELVLQNLEIVDRISIHPQNEKRLAEHLPRLKAHKKSPYVHFYEVKIDPKLNYKFASGEREKLYGKELSAYNDKDGIGNFDGVLIAPIISNCVQVKKSTNQNFPERQIRQPIDHQRLSFRLPQSSSEIADFLNHCKNTITSESVPVIAPVQAVLSAAVCHKNNNIKSKEVCYDTDGHLYKLVTLSNLVTPPTTYRIYPDLGPWGEIKLDI